MKSYESLFAKRWILYVSNTVVDGRSESTKLFKYTYIFQRSLIIVCRRERSRLRSRRSRLNSNDSSIEKSDSSRSAIRIH